MQTLPVLNAAAYKFVALDDLGLRRRTLRELCQRRGLRGTILLAEEGLNLFVAGREASIQELMNTLQGDPLIGPLDVKYSRSADLPFRRMLVKIKREIIAFDMPSVDPVAAPSPKISAEQLRQWLDEGRELALLDVRNDYEVELGTFTNATPIGVDHFRDFPAAVERLPTTWKDRTVVMFCTGGIRCEKAGPMMEQAGFRQVLQLDGGILKYFETCGDAHYDGDCFVFDQRVALDHQLQETQATLCFACQSVLSEQDQASPKYVPPKSCPHCYQPPDVRMAELSRRRRQQIAAATSPLPGSVAYENRRPLNVPQAHDGQALIAMLKAMHPHVSHSDWMEWFHAGRLVRQDIPLTPDSIVRAGERIERVEAKTIEPDVNADIEVLYEDAMLVVVNKPAPLPMHPSGRFNRNTLVYILDRVYAPQRLRIAHRLDANTTGVALLSRTRNVAARVQPQFEQGQVHKQYVARLHGTPPQTAFTCEAPIAARSGRAGARRVDPQGQAARTEFEILGDLGDGTSLVEARPITGRTNQIRIHLAHLGFPIVGDQLYRGAAIGSRQTLRREEQPLCLHAARLRLLHPEDQRPISFSAPLPEWARGAGLRFEGP